MDTVNSKFKPGEMHLFATPISHFSRKVRIFLDLYGAQYEFHDIGNVADAQTAIFAENPLMKVPVLRDGHNWWIESDHIASYLVEKLDPQDRYRVHSRENFDLNARAMMNGIMTEEVKVILARRTEVPTERYRFFDKALHAITHGLAWLETHQENFNSSSPGYREFHLVCLWDHLEYMNLVPMPQAGLRQIVAEVSQNPLIHQTAPSVLKPKPAAKAP